MKSIDEQLLIFAASLFSGETEKKPTAITRKYLSEFTTQSAERCVKTAIEESEAAMIE